MDFDAILVLLQKLTHKQLVSVLRRSYARNKKFRIPSFAKIENTPLKVISNNTKTRPFFKKEILASISEEFVKEGFSDDESLETISNRITPDNLLGVIAYLLSRENIESQQKAIELLQEHSSENTTSVLKEDVQSVDPATEIIEREKKKAERYKSKYSDIKKERDDLKAQIKQLNLQMELNLQDIAAQNDEIDRLTNEIENQKQEIIQKDETIKLLRSAEEKIKKEKAPKAQRSKKTALNTTKTILALGCSEALKKYQEYLNVDYCVPDDTNLEDYLMKYDNIWVAPNGVTFGMLRQLKKINQNTPNKINFFSTFQELYEYVDDFVRASAGGKHYGL